MKNLCIAVLFFASCSLMAQIDRTTMPEPGPAPEINLRNPQRFSLNNGLEVMVVEDHKLPRVSIRLLIDNPPILEGDKAGVSSLTGSLLGNGSTHIPKDEFNEEVDFLGATIRFGSQGAFASTLSKYYARILELLADAAIHPNFVQEEFDKEKEKFLTALEAEEKSVSAISSRVQGALAYGKDHPYGEFTTEETVNNIKLSDVKRFYSNYFVPANAYLVVIGDVSFDQTKELVTEYFTPWTKSVPPTFTFSRPSDAQFSQINFVDVPSAVQSEIAVQNLVSLQKKDEDYLPALIANEILGGGGEGRLFLNLREDKGYTYGSYSRLGNDKYAPARFRAVANVRNAVTDSAVVEILKEMEQIRSAPVTKEELKNTKAKYVGRFVRALEDPETIADYALDIETEDLPADFYKTYLERINAITVEEANEAAKKYIKPENARIIVVGNAGEVLENLEKVTFDGQKIPVRYMDKYATPTERPGTTMEVPSDMTVETVVNKYLEALGGREALESVTSYALLAEAETQGMKLNLELKKTAEDQFMQDVKVMGNSMSRQVLDGDEGYVVVQGQRTDLGTEEIEKIKGESAPFPELNYGKGGETLAGIEEVDGEPAYKIKVSDAKNAYYSVETGLKIQETNTLEMEGQTMQQTLQYDDYREVSGIRFPFRLTQTVGPQNIEFNVTEIKVNEGVSDVDFE